MKINELVAGTEVTVEVIIQGKTLNLKSNVLAISGATALYTTAGKRLHIDAEYCLMQLITAEDKPIRFDSDRFTIRVYASQEGTYYVWHTVRVEIVVLPDGQKCHAIFSTQEGVRTNRRGSFRLYVGKRLSVQFGAGRSKEVLLKDISVNGIGLVVPEEFECPTGTKVSLLFKDAYFALTIPLEGEVVRVTPMPEKGKLVGCQLTKVSPSLEKYIYDIQRKKLQEQRQGSRRHR